MKTLNYDTARCSGRFDFDPYGQWCAERETCQRFLALIKWDAAAGIQHYRGISVTMGREDCGIKIETLEITE